MLPAELPNSKLRDTGTGSEFCNLKMNRGDVHAQRRREKAIRRGKHEGRKKSRSSRVIHFSFGAAGFQSNSSLSGNKLGKAGNNGLVCQRAISARVSALGDRVPNSSRSYDSTRRGVRFWGNDSSMDADFIVSEQALHHLQSGLQDDQADFLRAFDLHRERILEVASRVYRREHRGMHVVGAGDF